MLWRMLPVWEDVNDYVFCRDLDSILTPRQMKFVYAFLNTENCIHNIHDNKSHSGIMGGMCGFKTSFIREKYSDFKSMIESYNTNMDFWSNKNTDQLFLNDFMRKTPKYLLTNHRQDTDNHDRRSNHRNCVDVIVNHVPTEVLNQADDYCNYIGAVGLYRGETDGTTHKEVIEFYEKHIDQDLLHKIKLLEQE